MKKTNATILALAAGMALIGVQAAEWGNWRGPNYNGSTDEKNLPAKFSKTKNVIWSVKMDGPSAGTPIVWGEHVYVSSSNPDAERLMANCYDRGTGALKWAHQVSKGHRQDNRSNYAAPSPVTDGQVVTFFYGNGELATFTPEGEKLWSQNIQKKHGQFAFLWTFSTSPIIHDGILYMQVLQRDTKVGSKGSNDNRSYLLALDPKSGRQLWKVYRPAKARSESLEAFSTPIPFTHNGRGEILITGGDCLTGHDPKSGEELWRWGTWNPTRIGHWRLVPSPVAGDGVVLACAPKRAPVFAIKAGGKGNISAVAGCGTAREVATGCPAMCARRCFIRAVFLCCTARAATRCFLVWNRKPAKFSGRATLIVAHSSAVHRLARMAKSTCRTTPAPCT